MKKPNLNNFGKKLKFKERSKKEEIFTEAEETIPSESYAYATYRPGGRPESVMQPPALPNNPPKAFPAAAALAGGASVSTKGTDLDVSLGPKPTGESAKDLLTRKAVAEKADLKKRDGEGESAVSGDPTKANTKDLCLCCTRNTGNT